MDTNKICQQPESLLFMVGLVILFWYLSTIELFTFEPTNYYQQQMIEDNSQDRNTDLIGLIYPARAGPLQPAFPTNKPVTAIYKTEPYIVRYNQGLPLCNR
jgi:hypothetical protein